MKRLSKDSKALLSLIATLRNELLVDKTSSGYVMEVKPATGAAPYRWMIMPYDARLFQILRDGVAANIEGAEQYTLITTGLEAIAVQYEVCELLLGTIAKDCISANKGVNCYRAHDTFFLTDGIIQVGIEKILPTDKPHYNH